MKLNKNFIILLLVFGCFNIFGVRITNKTGKDIWVRVRESSDTDEFSDLIIRNDESINVDWDKLMTSIKAHEGLISAPDLAKWSHDGIFIKTRPQLTSPLYVHWVRVRRPIPDNITIKYDEKKRSFYMSKDEM